MQALSHPSQLTFLLYILQRRIIWKKRLDFKKHKLSSENCASSRGRHSCYYGAEAEESLHKECADLWSRALRQPGLLLSSGTWLHPCPEAEKTDSAVHPSPAHQALPDGCHHVPRQVPRLGTWHSKGTPECRCPPGETETTGNFRDALTFIRCQYLAQRLAANIWCSRWVPSPGSAVSPSLLQWFTSCTSCEAFPALELGERALGWC